MLPHHKGSPLQNHSTMVKIRILAVIPHPSLIRRPYSDFRFVQGCTFLLTCCLNHCISLVPYNLNPSVPFMTVTLSTSYFVEYPPICICLTFLHVWTQAAHFWQKGHGSDTVHFPVYRISQHLQ